MLTKFHKVLIGLLVVQVLLAVLVLTRSDATSVVKEAPILPAFDAAKVTRLQVFAPPTDPEASTAAAAPKSVDLVKKDKSWVVANGFDYPVDGTKVTDALAPLAKLAAAEPIATQKARHKQLKVADDDFEHKITFTIDGKDTTLFVGNAVGSHRTAVRLGTSEDVYAVAGLTGTSFDPGARAWVANRYFEVPKENVTKLTLTKADGTTVELFKAIPPAPPPATGSGKGAGSGSGSGSAAPPPAPITEPVWTATINGAEIPLAVGEILDVSAIERAMAQATAIDLDAPADPKRDASKPTATITLDKKATGATSEPPIVLDVIADGNNYWVHDRTSPRAIMLTKPRLDDVIHLDKDHLVKKAPPPGSKPTPPPPPGGMEGLPPGIQLPPGFGGGGEE